MSKIKGIKRVRAKLADGTVVRYHYAWQGKGAPMFWKSDSGVEEGSAEYIDALAGARRGEIAAMAGRTGTSPEGELLISAAVDRFYSSGEFRNRKPRTREDYRRWLDRFSAEFGEDPVALFEERESRGELMDWRDNWQHSPKQADYALTVAVRFLNWAEDRQLISGHHCNRIDKYYGGGDRREIIWLLEHQRKALAVAPNWVQRVLISALETGLRPGDLVRLSRDHIKQTTAGRRISIKTNKRGRMASIPVTPAMAEVIDATPSERDLILVSEKGLALTPRRASNAVRDARNDAKLPAHLRLYDCRGTAATNLLRAGADLGQIAVFMGWSLKYASAVIEDYAAVDPHVSDELLSLLSVFDSDV